MLLFVLIFPTVVSYLLVPIGLKYLKTTVVAIYGYLILIVATIVSLLADHCHRYDLRQCLSGRSGRDEGETSQ